ncbi:hypothetical protein GOB93_13040 [Acetobacter musti]|uniref:Uncharacterized protein n=1 Tax=Acetobacter musti TaxID=864732 RepID=A0ABX0JRC6_9PROT|nr:hypothetical protein [Acetobacter musti]NHN85560.1 hypothetical protein [Acetobacter musti]
MVRSRNGFSIRFLNDFPGWISLAEGWRLSGWFSGWFSAGWSGRACCGGRWLLIVLFLPAMHWSRSAGGSLQVEALLLAVAMQGEALSCFCGVSGQTIVVTGNIVKFADNIARFLCNLFRRGGFPLPG